VSPLRCMSSYAPRSILITGGCGFIGSHLVLLLAERYPEYRLVVLDRLDYCSSERHLASLRGRAGLKAREPRSSSSAQLSSAPPAVGAG